MFHTVGSRAQSFGNQALNRWCLTNKFLTFLQRASVQAAAVNTFVTASWDTKLRDDVGAWTSSNPTVIKVPANWTRVRFGFLSTWAAGVIVATGTYAQIQKNGAPLQNKILRAGVNSSFINSTLETSWLVVKPGDQFTFLVLNNANSSGWRSPNTFPTVIAEWLP